MQKPAGTGPAGIQKERNNAQPLPSPALDHSDRPPHGQDHCETSVGGSGQSVRGLAHLPESPNREIQTYVTRPKQPSRRKLKHTPPLSPSAPWTQETAPASPPAAPDAAPIRPQLGHRPPSTPSAQSTQNVHSKEQMRAAGLSGGRSQSQHSQFGRSSNISLALPHPCRSGMAAAALPSTPE